MERSARLILHTRLVGAPVLAFALIGGALAPGASASRPTAGDMVRTYPAVDGFNRLVLGNGTLSLTGSVSGGGGSASNCLTATFDPATLALGRVMEPECDSPLLLGSTVAAEGFNRSPSFDGYDTARVTRIGPNGSIEVGPPLFSYELGSGTQLVTASYGGSLWVFEGDARPGGQTVVRLSSTTGQVLQTTRVPGVWQPVMVADADGLYLAPSGFGGGFGDGSGDDSVLYRVAIGASSPVVVRRLGPSSGGQAYTKWMTADGQQLWADFCQRGPGGTCAIWRFAGPNLTPVFHSDDSLGTSDWVTGDPSGGFYTSIQVQGGPFGLPFYAIQFVRVDPETGTETPVASLQLSGSWSYGPTNDDRAVVSDHVLYVLDSSSGGAASLHRVPLP